MSLEGKSRLPPAAQSGPPYAAVFDPAAITAQRKITRRLLPFLFLLYITAFLDRVNVSFAGLDMTRELGFSNEVFGFGAGIFFFGYCLLEIPGAMLVEMWSAREPSDPIFT